MKILFFLSAILIMANAIAQPIYLDKKNNREYYIYRDSDPELIEDFLKSVKAEAIEFSPFDETYILKDKEDKWHLYSDLQEKMTQRGYDSLGFVTPDVPYTVVKNLNKYGILKSPFKYENTESEVRFIFNDIKSVEKDGKKYLIGKRGRKWAQIDWYTGVNYTPYIHLDYRKMDYKELSREELEFIKAVRRKKGFDFVEFDRVNGNDIFIARQGRLRKWGMYKGKDVNNLTQLIPNEFDSLEYFPSNNTFTPVYLGGKVGFYTMVDNEVKKLTATEYEAFKRVEINDFEYLAVQKQGRWGWMDWFTGEIKVNSISPEFDKLPTPDWKSKYYSR
ncbi:hypothetical protein HZR84_13315 [Hyphobacterium sp. CCMP332]|nr:hypothetical protein HZR84_13315 [Hyphobacterium sp. CCMP332]